MLTRGIAAFVALWLVGGGVLARHHAADAPHARDRAGGFVHAQALAGHHTSRHADIHGQQAQDADDGDCALLTAAHQPASAAIARPAIIAGPGAPAARPAPRQGGRAPLAASYRLAPKTSPPATV